MGNAECGMRNWWKRQEGASIIAAIFIIVILGFMGLMFVTMIGTGILTAVDDFQAAKALAVAEGGLEFALRNGTFPDYTYGATPLGDGSFATVSQFLGPGGTAPATVTDNPLSDTATTVNVTSTAGYVVPGAFRIEGEFVFCTAAGGTQFTGCIRGWAGTAPAMHAAGSEVIQCVANSTGTIDTAGRTVRASIGSGSTTLFSEPFPAGSVPLDTNPGNRCSVVPALSWCFQYTNTLGVSQYHADNAPGSLGGSLEAETDAVANAHLAGYRQKALPAPLTAGRQVIAGLWYKKTRGHAQTQRIDMAVVLLATDGTAYQLWSNPDIVTIGWTQVITPLFTVPAGKTIDRIRLAFDIQNRASGGGSTNQSYIWLDEVVLTNSGGTILLSWMEAVN